MRSKRFIRRRPSKRRFVKKRRVGRSARSQAPRSTSLSIPTPRHYRFQAVEKVRVFDSVTASKRWYVISQNADYGVQIGDNTVATPTELQITKFNNVMALFRRCKPFGVRVSWQPVTRTSSPTNATFQVSWDITTPQLQVANALAGPSPAIDGLLSADQTLVMPARKPWTIFRKAQNPKIPTNNSGIIVSCDAQGYYAHDAGTSAASNALGNLIIIYSHDIPTEQLEAGYLVIQYYWSAREFTIATANE